MKQAMMSVPPEIEARRTSAFMSLSTIIIVSMAFLVICIRHDFAFGYRFSANFESEFRLK